MLYFMSDFHGGVSVSRVCVTRFHECFSRCPWVGAGGERGAWRAAHPGGREPACTTGHCLQAGLRLLSGGCSGAQVGRVCVLPVGTGP